MTEFNKGDRVVFVKDDEHGGVKMPKGTRATCDDEYASATVSFVLLDSGERVLAWRDYIAHAEDLAKVAITLKGGDYIEAESDGTKIGGKVSHVTARGFVAIEHLGEFAVHHLTPSPLPKGCRMFVLTDHQPAPEPEPEWKPGTVWADQEGERYWFTDNGGSREDGEGPVFRNDVGDEYETSEMGDVRPLVVIDPAAVDVDMLVDTAHNNAMTKREVVEHVLGTFGIEVPR